MSGSSRSLNIVLPDDMDRMVKLKIASGQYATESEVICAGLRTLEDSDGALEEWLTTEVARTYDEFRADPQRAVPAETVLARLEARFSAISDGGKRDAQG